MQHYYVGKSTLLAALLALGAASTRAQRAPTDSLAAPRSSAWLVKGGLRLTHFSYSRSGTSWRLLVPVSLAIERRLGSHFSLYAQLEPDMQLASAARRRRRSSAGADAGLYATAMALGSRYYYGRPAAAAPHPASAPEFGKYVALELGADITKASASVLSSARATAGGRSLLTPALYALWGIQNRLRPHLLYDLNAGLGVLAPTRSSAEYPLRSHGWDVGAQVNIRLYWASGSKQ